MRMYRQHHTACTTPGDSMHDNRGQIVDLRKMQGPSLGVCGNAHN